jgi:hypothetical protein
MGQNLIKMTKQEVIKEAWGIERFNVLSPHINDNGWLDEDYLINKYEFNLADCDTENGAFINMDDLTTYYRPKSLKGIENNNGWTKVDFIHDLSNRTGISYKSILPDGTIETTHNFSARELYNLWKITHYKVIEKDLPPLY